MFKKILLIVVTSLFIFGISKLSFAMMCGEHSGHLQMAQAHSEHEHDTTEAAGQQTASTEVVNVDNKVCPVSGEKIDDKTKATYEYEGKIYNFCCAMCIEEFKKNPEKYIKKVEEELQTEAKEQSEQTEHEMEMMQEPETMHQGMQEGHHH